MDLQGRPGSRHTVFLPTYRIARVPVTNAQYAAFVRQACHPAPGGWCDHCAPPGHERYPVVNVSWNDAAEYCNWLSAKEGLEPAYQSAGGRLVPVVPATGGYRLPTEAEWEWAARGSALRKYPWGDALPVPPGAGNFADARAQPLVPQILPGYDDGHAATAPVGSFAPNGSGFFDLGGNVAEWTHDLYTVQPASSAVAVDPAAGGAGTLRVIRGSSWRHSAVTELRLAYRDYGDGKRNDLGFRIARYAQ